MNRAIKFRAWDKKEKKMYKPFSMDEVWYSNEDDGIHFGNGLESDRKLRGKELVTFDILEDCILMQFTGLKDKNGKEIYESDLVKYNNRIYEVRYYLGGFELFEKDTKCACFNTWWENTEIIGNIVERRI